MSAPLQGSQSAAVAIAQVSYSHDAMIDLVIANPQISQNELAKHFGYTAPWISRIFNSDAFLARLAVRKGDIVDPSLVATVDEKLRAAASLSLDVVVEKLALTRSADLATKVMDISTRALGYGARSQNLNVQNNFVVALPPKAANAAEWSRTHGPVQVVETVEAR